MTAVTDRTFMNTFCQPERLGISRPFAMDGFDCATTGHVLLMMPGATFEPNPSAPPVAHIIGMKLKKAGTTDFDKLLLWATTSGDLNPICETCGTKSKHQEITVGQLAGRLVNRRLLSKCLLQLKAEKVDIHVGDELDPVLIKCAAWKLYVMPVRRADGNEFEFAFPIKGAKK